MTAVTIDDLKRAAARAIGARVRDGEVLGVGSGSTVLAAVAAIGQRIGAEGLRVAAVAASYEAEDACAAAGIDVIAAASRERLDWAFDGADEVDPHLDLLKGRGGAILRERIVATMAARFVIVGDESKLVERLGTNFPVPVEVAPAARHALPDALRALGASDVELRMCRGGKDGPVITEYGNLLIDARFPSIERGLDARIKAIPGVVETGLFEDICDELLVAKHDGLWRAVRGAGGVTWARSETL